MGMNQTPSSERIHIGIFGKMNVGKSSVINAITGQDLAIVSDVPGTTTDPVYKTMELLPIGPVVIMDTPGLDDTSVLGSQRIAKTIDVLKKSDLALVVVDSNTGISDKDQFIIDDLKKRRTPFLVVLNKADVYHAKTIECEENHIVVSALTGFNIFELKERIGAISREAHQEKYIVMDILKPKSYVVLVVPIDSAAPKGRIILPQQQVLREVLDFHGKCMVVQPEELKDLLDMMKQPPALVITDSQVFEQIKDTVPSTIMLTSFSILFARYKGNLKEVVAGARVLKTFAENKPIKILIAEGCTHHRQCDDIGTVKLPKWIQKYLGHDNIEFKFTSGTGFVSDFEGIDLVVHCGGCMLNTREMGRRIDETVLNNVPITNYGILIAHMNGILDRSVELFASEL
ncbi:[FeFe] hydrogenase H-cluster maturation GTPase HydF [Fusibacter tunisiensis]|uniref:[FeFe] hydrogenase H-cluster maturation GTPase HydF n=1 Tax=Fusibacter tunisiensis TaxID=1008308 RepID=A0ABS2MUT0_9FIRM|nr:[FeFe] hydrogenase H-cluster maturation GTPase HydF [Fusibacter tunisiensis]MBM7563012.1 [FeFe] hydrogenase H-cluster maturation GTPase HydF [Fusibacter tunisiensis]